MWSTVSDSYVTEETKDPKIVHDRLLADELKRVVDDFEKHWPKRIKNARKFGTSGLGPRRTDRWDLSMEERRAAGELDDEDDEDPVVIGDPWR